LLTNNIQRIIYVIKKLQLSVIGDIRVVVGILFLDENFSYSEYSWYPQFILKLKILSFKISNTKKFIVFTKAYKVKMSILGLEINARYIVGS